ncbi:MAG: hypothetical protein CSB49_01495 [Proteobacteria bacterium]|nr:MAG: hypothetical protein CSB49_01495 [Pseudomonadota bacterium]
MRTLDLSNNRLTNLQNLHLLFLLKELIVNHNQLTTIRSAGDLRLLKVFIAHHNKLRDKRELGFIGSTGRPRYTHYDFRHNLLMGVPALMLYRGVSRSGTYVVGGYRRRHYGGYRGSRRYGGGGGYRYGK